MGQYRQEEHYKDYSNNDTDTDTDTNSDTEEDNENVKDVQEPLHRKYALISLAAYDDQYDLNQYGLSDYLVDNDLSNKRTLVAVNEKNKHVIVGYRGTVPTEGEDMFYNGLIGVGLQKRTKEYKKNKNVAEQAMAKYSDYNVETTGHSRGALDAYTIGQELGLHSHVFNPPDKAPTSLIGAATNFLVNKVNDSSDLYYTYYDPVGWLGRKLPGKRHFFEQKYKDPHTIENFL